MATRPWSCHYTWRFICQSMGVWIWWANEPIFDSDYNNLATPSPPENTIRSQQAADELRSTPGIIPESSPEIIPQPHESYDGWDVDHDTQPDADLSLEQLDPTSTNPRSSKYDLRHNPEPNCNDFYRYWLCQTTAYGTHTYTFRKPQERVMELICAKPTYSSKHLKQSPDVTIEHYRALQ